MRIEDSIVLIKSNSDRNDIGTGFVIYQDETASYILTCAHVVKALGGEERIKVDGSNATVTSYGFEVGEETLDLAVLRVEGLKKPAMNLWTLPNKGDSLTICGYCDFDGKRTYRRLNIDGKLENYGFRRINGENVKDWDLLVTGRDLLKPGCSGSPVLNQRNEVIGVVTHMLEGGKKGTAISVEALEKLGNWGIDIRPHLCIPCFAIDEKYAKIHSLLAVLQQSPVDDLTSSKNIDYTKLRDLLAAGKWEAANQETADRLLEIIRKQSSAFLASFTKRSWAYVARNDLQRLPRTDFKTIDRLWVKYSNGNFGFSIQKLIYGEKFIFDALYKPEWSENKFNNLVPMGYFPNWGSWDRDWVFREGTWDMNRLGFRCELWKYLLSHPDL